MATGYVDQITGSGETVAYKAPCRVATTADIALSGLQTVDGVVLAVDDRVLVKNQSNAVDNGIWIVSTGVWSRARDFDSNRDVTKGTRVSVTDGTVARSTWAITTENPINVGASLITFEVVTFGQYIVVDEDDMASDSATKVPTQQSVKAYADATPARIVVNAAAHTIEDEDLIGIVEVDAPNVMRKSTFTSVKAFLKTYFDTLYATVTGTRVKLTGARTYYVNSGTGSDGADGLTVGTPFATIQKAIDTVYGLDLNGFAVTIQLANGTYTTGGRASGAMVGGSAATPLTIQGDTGTPANVLISTTSAHCFEALSGAEVFVTGVKMQTTTSGDCLFAQYNGEMRFGAVDFGTCAGFHKNIADNARMYNTGNYTISGSAMGHEHCNNGSYMLNFGATVTLTGTPAWSSYFVGISHAIVQYVNMVYSGAATGQRFLVHENALLWTTESDTFLPGNAVGLRANNGVYRSIANTVLPQIVGGQAVNSSLVLKSTENVGTTDYIALLVGNNGATEAMRAVNSGRIGIGKVAPDGQLEVGTGPTWSSLNIGANIIISGNKNNALGITDSAGGNPWAIVNASGTLWCVQMPALGNTVAGGTTGWALDSSRNFGIGTFTPDRRLHSEVDDASTAAVTYAQRLTHTTSGTPANGIGVGYEFEVETSASNNEVGATMEAVVTDVTSTAENFDLIWKVMTAGAAATEKMRLKSTGQLVLSGSMGRGAPVTKTGNFSVAVTENWLIVNQAGSTTVTLPAAASFTGREIMIRTIQAQTVVSASSNVVPLIGGAAGTAILAATAGKWASLVSDGTNWQIMAGN